MTDAERMLRAARRPLVLGIGGGGDVVGALATAEHARLHHGADPLLGGVTWERRVVDPEPGPRRADEIEGARELAPAVIAAGPETRVRASGVRPAESRMAELLDEEVLLVDPNRGPRAVAEGLAAAADLLGADLVAFVDVGGDVLAHGDEPGLSSPLCDAVLLAAAAHLAASGRPVLGGIFGPGCDGELTPAEVDERLTEVGAAGGLAGTWGLTPDVVTALERAVAAIPTEASALPIRAFHGERGPTEIRSGRRTVELTANAAITAYFDVPAAIGSAARLAAAVRDASSLEEANDLLHRLGVTSELDLERRAVAGR